MSSHTETITVTCPAMRSPAAFPPPFDLPCDGENEVEITFGWDPGQNGGTTDPSWSAHVEDVEVPAIHCEACGHDFTQSERDAIAKDFEATVERGDDYDGPDTVSERDDWADPRFNWDINGRCAP
jgi:hypothetical protein